MATTPDVFFLVPSIKNTPFRCELIGVFFLTSPTIYQQALNLQKFTVYPLRRDILFSDDNVDLRPTSQDIPPTLTNRNRRIEAYSEPLFRQI